MESYKNFLDKIQRDSNSIILWAIPSDVFLHPCATDVSVVFIKNVDSKETCCLSLNHSDLPSIIDKVNLIEDLNGLNVNKWTFNKKSFIQLLPAKELLDISLYSHIQEGRIIDEDVYKTSAHKFIYRSKKNCGDLNKVVPILKHKETFEKMCIEFFKIDLSKMNDGFKKENRIVIETLAELESNGIYVNSDCFTKHFDVRIQSNSLVYSQYNIYTSTGRPSNHFNNINYAALNKENGVRTCFTSRYGNSGMMVLIDYSAFHPRIISNIVNFPLDINEDIYKYLGEMYFHRKVTEYDMEEIKSITMRQLYGGVDEKYENIKYFGSLKEFINNNWELFKKNGYVLTPIFKRKITNQHLKDANPSKLFNYILQATETEIALSAVQIVNKYLKDKKTKAVLYTYDSLLFDFHKDDGSKVLGDIMNIMMMNNRFPIKVYKGESYDSVIQIYP